MSAGWVAVPIVASAALVVAVLLMIGSGDRTPSDPACLPDMPRINGTHPVTAGASVVPLPQGSYTVSSPFGPRAGGFHRGVDLAAPQGTPILAATDGVVVAAGPAEGFGNWIVLDAQRPDGLTSTVYGHMFSDGVLAHVGDHVQAGQQIGKVGAAGEATGPHLHFEVWSGGRLHGGGHPIDPVPWLGAATATPTTAPASPDRGVAVSSRAARRRNVLASSGCDPTPAPDVGGMGSLRAGSVPPEYEPWIRKAATQCPELSAPILAAQLKQESGFNRWARSSAGALGPAQFMPGTWATHGVSADGNGTPDPFSIPDAVMSQGKYACELIGIVKQGLADGRLHGDLTQLWLSAYNCGAANTLAQGGVCQNSQTLGYVRNIPAMAAAFTAPEQHTDVRAEAGGIR
ncbi:peptidoglycan DD-metalloendopeptidase family protein [Nocardia jiangxiensis]|uniref:Peptidoglycan DD-metalloendopeptidase family protein n=1 Tax=Nocardia jiangxiensis TaxID=282685 RepID=A0ABW6S0N6_9NOCA